MSKDFEQNTSNEVLFEQLNVSKNNIQNKYNEESSELIIEDINEQPNYQSINDAHVEDLNIIRIKISKIGYVMFIVLGLTTVCAWNLWITAVPFFKNRLSGTIFQDNFQNYISFVFMFTSTLSSFVALKIQQKISINRRILDSLILLILCFLATTILSLIPEMNSYTFFIIIMSLIVVSAISTAVLQNGGFGLTAQLPNIYTQGIMNGQGLGGAIVVIVQIIIVINSHNTEDDNDQKFLKNMYLYFFSVVLITLICLVGYLTVIKKLAAKVINDSINNRNENTSNINNEETPLIINNDSNIEGQIVVNNEQKIINTFKKIKVQALSLFCTFVITLSLFPSVISGIESVTKEKNSNSYNNLFVSIAFLIFTLSDWVGKVMPGYPMFTIKNTKIINTASFSRILFIIIFMICNVQFKDTYGNPLDRSLPILIHSDLLYFILLFIFSISNGYISSLLLIITPDFVDDDEKELSGSIMVFVLSLGLACGSIFSFAIRAMLCKCNPFIS